MTDVVAPPASNPWDVVQVAESALDVLRLDPADMDAARIETFAAEAVDLIDQDLDMPEPYVTIPAPLVGAAVTQTVDLYRRKDAPGGMTDSWSSDGTFLRFSVDPLKGIRPIVNRYKARRGVA